MMMKTERDYLYLERRIWPYSVELSNRHGDARAATEVKLEEVRSPNQTRLLLTLRVWMPLYEDADPVEETEVVLSRFTADYKAIRKAIKHFDSTCAKVDEYLEYALEQAITEPDATYQPEVVD